MLAMRGYLIAQVELVVELVPVEVVEVPQILLPKLQVTSQVQAAQQLITNVEIDAAQQEGQLVILLHPPA
jgi:hypothetical protein